MRSEYPDPGRVWQRVLQTEPQEQQTLQMLLRQLSMDLAFLKRHPVAKDDPLIMEYAEQLHSLKGILLLTGGSIPRDTASVSEHSLQRCFDHGLRRLSAYQLRTSDPVYGPVFRELAAQTGQHCFRITQLLGRSLQGGKEKGR
jgi:hypothetical protein